MQKRSTSFWQEPEASFSEKIKTNPRDPEMTEQYKYMYKSLLTKNGSNTKTQQ